MSDTHEHDWEWICDTPRTPNSWTSVNWCAQCGALKKEGKIAFPSDRSDLAAAQDRIARLERDAARMEWLDHNAGCHWDALVTTWYFLASNRYKSLREAIDAALETESRRDD